MVSASLLLWSLLAVVIVQRAAELRLARQHEVWVRERGAQEFGARHYPAFFVLHGAWLLAWPLEAALRGPTLAPGWASWLLLFTAAQALRYWAIRSLGTRWNTRILLIPGEPPIRRGPYRWISHPNYVAVVTELAALPLIFGAYWTASVIGALNLALLLGVRIPVEARAWRDSLAQDRAGRKFYRGLTLHPRGRG